MTKTETPEEQRRVLVVEDEFEIGLDIQSTLSAAGFSVTGPLMTYEEATSAAREGDFDAAVLDANLNGKNGGSVATILTERRVPFVVVSGYARNFLPIAFQHAPSVAKPFDPGRLIAAVERLCRDRHS